jgi:thiol-disulfide isomerase/thioredoxin
MKKSVIVLALLAPVIFGQDLVSDVRDQIGKNNFPQAQALIDKYRASKGTSPEAILAVSWMGRGLLARKDYGGAEKYAAETYKLATAELKKRPLDKEMVLPTALGASIEVQGQVFAGRGDRGQAVVYLNDELKKYYNTSIRTRIQKNIMLLSLEGKPAPTVAGVPVPKGKPVILFFWAHWCPDCKREAPILAKLRDEFRAKDLTIVATTQKYGYVANGDDAPPAVEIPYIEKIRKEFYSSVVDAPARISEEAFKSYGASTTPTLVLVDRAGIVRTYHPGDMTYEELRAKVLPIL